MSADNYTRQHLLETMRGYLRDAEDYERAGDVRAARNAYQIADHIAAQLRGDK